MFIRNVFLLAIGLWAVGFANATVIDFESLYAGLDKDSTNAISTSYMGMAWSGRFRVMTQEFTQLSSGVGYTTGRIGKVVAYTSGPSDNNIVELSAAEAFDLGGAYITSVWKMNQDVLVEGYRGGQLVHAETIMTSSDRAYWFDLDFDGIDLFRITPGTGGTDVYSNYRGNHLAIDNITIVPEPATGGLLAIGMLIARRMNTVRKKKTRGK